MNRSHHHALRRIARSLTIGAATVLAVSCGIQTEGIPRDVPEDARVDLAEVGSAGQADPIGGRRVYFVLPDGTGTVLRSTPRDVGASPTDVLTALLQGPTITEQAARLRTAVPPDTTLNAVGFASQGVLRIDLSAEIFDATGDTLIDAVAQLVYTAHEIEGVDEVLLQVDGQSQQWPRADGTLVAGTLTIYDFPNRAVSTQADFPALPSPSD